MKKRFLSEDNMITVAPKGLLFTIYLDEVFENNEYYREVLNVLETATENDEIILQINSDGGSLVAGLPIINAMKETKALTTTRLLCEANSLASMILLMGDNIHVAPYSSMLVHSVSFGVGGKGVDVKAQVDHTMKRCEEIFRDVYEFFLSEEEMEKVLNGKEEFYDFEQITTRLASRRDKLLQEQQEFLEKLENVNAPPCRERLLKMTKKEILNELLGEEQEF